MGLGGGSIRYRDHMAALQIEPAQAAEVEEAVAVGSLGFRVDDPAAVFDGH